MSALLTDLYELTMAAGYYQAGKTAEIATFELFVRDLPSNRNYVAAAGLPQAIDYLTDLRFTAAEIDYLKGLPQFSRVAEGFFEMLAGLRFTGDVDAVPEGTVVFAGEPMLRVRAPLIQAQVAETYLLSMIGFQSLIATKASRLVNAAGGRSVVEFGTRRAHSPEAGTLAGRAAFVGGCIGTSNTLTGMRYGVPVFGTAAHSWIQAFESELEAFRELQKLLGGSTIYLVDTYDTIAGARLAAALGEPMWGVRLDSGNLVELSREVRRVLDDAGFSQAKIMVTGDLNEYKVLEMMKETLPVDAFGVGTELATSADDPRLGAVYKLVELEDDGSRRYTAKLSTNKQTLPGAKQVFRYPDRDLIGRAGETPPPGPGGAAPEALLQPVLRRGELIAPLPGVHAARERLFSGLAKLPVALRSLFTVDPPYPVEISPGLRQLYRETRRTIRGGKE